MKARATRTIAYHGPEGLVVLHPGDVAEVPQEIVEAHPGWFEPVEEAPTPATTQVQEEEARKRRR